MRYPIHADLSIDLPDGWVEVDSDDDLILFVPADESIGAVTIEVLSRVGSGPPASSDGIGLIARFVEGFSDDDPIVETEVIGDCVRSSTSVVDREGLPWDVIARVSFDRAVVLSFVHLDESSPAVELARRDVASML